jgi:hypothetical protein
MMKVTVKTRRVQCIRYQRFIFHLSNEHITSGCAAIAI